VSGVGWLRWVIGIGVNLAVVAALVGAALRGGPSRRAALLGTAAGSSFGLTAALMKAMTTAITAYGFLALFTTWQTYAMIAAGGLAMFLLQSALNAGTLLAAQPGITSADPVVSILWGVLGFGETVRGGVYLALAAVSAAVIGWGVYRLSRSPLVAGEDADGSAPPAGHGEHRGDERAAPNRADVGGEGGLG